MADKFELRYERNSCETRIHVYYQSQYYLCFKCPNLLDQNAQMRYGLDIQTLPDTHNTFFLQQNAGQGEITLTQNIHT